jgi:hypothetical protein
MGKTKKMPKAAVPGAKVRHHRKHLDRLARAPSQPPLVAAPRATVPAVKSKHHSYFEFVENKGHKQKKLEFEVIALV